MKINKTFGTDLEHLHVLKALCGDNPEQNVRTIHTSNPEHLPVFKAPRGDDPEQNPGTIHASNPEHLIVFKGLRWADPEHIDRHCDCLTDSALGPSQ